MDTTSQRAKRAVSRARRRARLIAIILAAPVLVLGALALSGLVLNPGAAVMSLPIVFLCLLSVTWTYWAFRGPLTPQLTRTLWLRRFHTESGIAFEVSRVVDALAKDGIGALTLKDSVVRLSSEQRRHRRAANFRGLMFTGMIVCILFGALLFWAAGATPDTSGDDIFSDTTIAIMGGMLAFGAAIFAPLITLPFMLLTMVFEPVTDFLDSRRNDFDSLSKNLFDDARLKRGTQILRIKDADWKLAVERCLNNVETAIIDISDISDAIVWELTRAFETVGPKGIVFIGKESAVDPLFAEGIQIALPNGMGEISRAEVIIYPDMRSKARGPAEDFGERLREAIFAANDRIDSLPANVAAQRAETRAKRQRRERRVWIVRCTIGGLIAGGIGAIALYATLNQQAAARASQAFNGCWVTGPAVDKRCRFEAVIRTYHSTEDACTSDARIHVSVKGKEIHVRQEAQAQQPALNYSDEIIGIDKGRVQAGESRPEYWRLDGDTLYINRSPFKRCK